MGFEPAQSGQRRFTSGGDSTYCAINAENKQFSKPHLSSEYATQIVLFSMFTNKHNVNIAIISWQHYSKSVPAVGIFDSLGFKIG